MKRLIAVISVFAMLLTLGCGMPMTVQAKDNPTVTVETVEAAPGTTVDVDIKLSACPDLTTVYIIVNYDTELLEYVETDNASDVYHILDVLGTVPKEDLEKGTLKLVWNQGTKNYDVNGDFATLTFKVKETAPVGATAELTVYQIDDGTRRFPELVYYDAEAGKNIVVSSTVVNGAVKICELKSAIKSARLALGADISINYYAKLLENETAAQMRFTMNGKELTVAGTLDAETGLYIYPFSCITPEQMGDTVKAELILDEKVLDVKDGYSVLQNCKNLLAKTPDELGISETQYDAMKTLIADLLVYGGAAQQYQNHNTDTKVSEDTVMQTLTPTAFTALGANADKGLFDIEEVPDLVNTTYFTAAGVRFGVDNRLYVKFKTDLAADGSSNFLMIGVSSDYTDEVYYGLNDCEDLGDGEYRLLLDPMSADKMVEVYEGDEGEEYIRFYVTLYSGKTVKKVVSGKMKEIKSTDVQIQFLSYCVASYVYAKQDESTDIAALAKALYNYAVSANRYVNAE